jgi:hypothetical protein
VEEAVSLHLTEKQIADLRAAHAASTPGEWNFETKYPGVVLGGPFHTYTNGSCQSQVLLATGSESVEERDANTRFCAMAHNHMPAILAELERLRKQVEGQSEELKRSAEVASLYKRAFQFTEAASTSARGVLSIVAELRQAEAILRAGKEDSWAAEEQWTDGQYLEKTQWVKDAESWLSARLERAL